MQCRVKEGEESGHAPETDHGVPTGQAPQRSQRQRDADEPQSPNASLVREIAERVRAEISREPGPQQPRARTKSGEEDDRFENLNSASSDPCRYTGRPPAPRSR